MRPTPGGCTGGGSGRKADPGAQFIRPAVWLVLFFGLLCCAPAGAVIYKYVDAEGNVTFTDKYRPGARKITDDGGGPVTSIPAPRRPRTSVSNPSPADFPKVDRQTQRKRDDVRRTILLEELAAEEKGLAAAQSAQKALAKSASTADRTRLTEGVRLHEKNIEMLRKELARIK